MSAGRQYAATVERKSRGLDLFIMRADNVREVREVMPAMLGDDLVRVLTVRLYAHTMSEAKFDPYGILARQREDQREQAMRTEDERRQGDSLVVAMLQKLADDLRAEAELAVTARDAVPHDPSGPGHTRVVRLEAVGNTYRSAARRVDVLIRTMQGQS